MGRFSHFSGSRGQNGALTFGILTRRSDSSAPNVESAYVTLQDFTPNHKQIYTDISAISVTLCNSVSLECAKVIFIWLQYCGKRLWRAVGRCWLRSRVSPEIDLPVLVHSREVYSSPDRWQCNHLDLGCKFIQVRKCPFMQVKNT